MSFIDIGDPSMLDLLSDLDSMSVMVFWEVLLLSLYRKRHRLINAITIHTAVMIVRSKPWETVKSLSTDSLAWTPIPI